MVCNHPAREPSHDRCRSHALCSIEGRYNRSGCPACDVLWQQARSSNPAEASPALARLKEWTEGFSRNSKQSEYFEKLDIFSCSSPLLYAFLDFDFDSNVPSVHLMESVNIL